MDAVPKLRCTSTVPPISSASRRAKATPSPSTTRSTSGGAGAGQQVADEAADRVGRRAQPLADLAGHAQEPRSGVVQLRGPEMVFSCGGPKWPPHSPAADLVAVGRFAGVLEQGEERGLGRRQVDALAVHHADHARAPAHQDQRRARAAAAAARRSRRRPRPRSAGRARPRRARAAGRGPTRPPAPAPTTRTARAGPSDDHRRAGRARAGERPRHGHARARRSARARP